MKKFNRTSNQGFTLIELLVVISIISLLASMIMGSMSQSRRQARDIQRVRTIREVQKAFELYALSNGGKYTPPTANFPPGAYPFIACWGCTSEAYTLFGVGPQITDINTALTPYLRLNSLPIVEMENHDSNTAYASVGGSYPANGLWFLAKDSLNYKLLMVHKETSAVPASLIDTNQPFGNSCIGKVIGVSSSPEAQAWQPPNLTDYYCN